MNAVTLLLAATGLVCLVVGADRLVNGASRLAASFGVSPLVIGLTVVAFGTSAPELAVSIKSGLAGQSDIALGNIVGSNILNILLILGLSAAITPLVVSQQLVRLDVPLLVGTAVLLMLMALDGRISPFDGLLLAGGILAYTGFAIWHSRRESPAVQAGYDAAYGSAASDGLGVLLRQLLSVLVGLALLLLGAHWLVEGAVALARWFGLSELIIGLTIVAIGTSLPEIAASVVAALKGERDIAVGNIVGSCLFNTLAVAGFAALVTPGGLQAAAPLVRFDLPVMIVVMLACLPIFATGHRIARWEGALFLAYYAAYLTYLVLAATRHSALKNYGDAMLGFVLPLTAVTLLVLWVRYRVGAAEEGSGEPPGRGG